MRFKVNCLSPEQLVQVVEIEAYDEHDARRQIEARGLFAASVKPMAQSGLAAAWSRQADRRIPLVLFSQELLALLEAGLSIVEGLEALLEKETAPGTRSVLSRLLDCLYEGKRFSAALSEQPEQFPALFVGIVRAAEGTSDLPRSLQRYIAYRERVDAVRAKIISASIYPAILFCVGGAVAAFLIGYVVPKFAQVYQGTGRSLPWMSQLLLDWGHFASLHGRGLLIGLMLVLPALLVVVLHLRTTGFFDRLIARIPAIGERVRIIELSRLYLTMGMLLEGGIPITTALDTVSDMVSRPLRVRITAARDAILAGTNFSSAFEAAELTTPISLRMLRVGEKSGALGSMLSKSANFYDGEITRWIDRFTRSFEPLLMAAIGLIIGTIVILLYMPIFDLAGSLS